MKTHFTSATVLLASLTLVACSGEHTEQSSTESAAPAVESTAEAPAVEAPAVEQAEPIKEAAEPAVVATKQADDVAAAKTAISALGGTLKGELMAAMKEGGPVAALTVCNEKAPVITDKVSTDQGMQVSRTSLKYRNADNAPTEWEKVVLENFESRKANGEDPKTMAYSEVVEIDGKQEFRFMKAVPTGGACLACHGETLSPELTAKIQTLYPQDLATGFKLGDIRGAFVVTKTQ